MQPMKKGDRRFDEVWADLRASRRDTSRTADVLDGERRLNRTDMMRTVLEKARDLNASRRRLGLARAAAAAAGVEKP
jgi:hypothetical protein